MFRPLITLGYSEHHLDGLDNPVISAQVIQRKALKFEDAGGHTRYEDSYLPDTPECLALRAQVREVMRAICPDLEEKDHWAHILEPRESTMYHDHESPGRITLSWVYYAQVPPDSGNLCFIVYAAQRRRIVPVQAEVGKLVVFAGFLPHYTQRNNSDETRVSISGNYIVRALGPNEKPNPGSIFHYIGNFNA